MSQAQKILVLGSQTFLASAPRVGIQVIAEGLAERGYEVHYVSAPSSPLDLLSKPRRRRFTYAWLNNSPQPVKKNLYEHVLRAPFPINKKVWVRSEQYKLYSSLLNKRFTQIQFDACIHDTSPTYTFLERLTIETVILRLNDQPEGFSFHMPGVVTQKLLSNIEENVYTEIWSVSSALTKYAVQKSTKTPVLDLPNGVNLERFLITEQCHRVPKTATFVGAIERWVDLALLNEVAVLLPDWQFDLYGPLGTSLPSLANLSYKGVIDFNEVAATLARYQVGLIPFGQSELIEVMERPLKFYEYLAAGLGVASTKVGNLQAGMSEWAHFGSTPSEFAGAILKAAEDADTKYGERQNYLSAFTWDSILDTMTERLEQLC